MALLFAALRIRVKELNYPQNTILSADHLSPLLLMVISQLFYTRPLSQIDTVRVCLPVVETRVQQHFFINEYRVDR